MYQSLRGDGEVDELGSVMAHAAVVEIDQLVHRLHLSVLLFVVEPSWTDTDVAFRRHPGVAVGMALLQFPVALVARMYILTAQESPVGGKRKSLLVADPSASRSLVGEDDCLRLEFGHHLPCPWKIVVGLAVDSALLFRATIPAVAAIGAVEPHFEQFAILRQQFLELRIEVFHVEGSAVESLMAIPRRKV